MVQGLEVRFESLGSKVRAWGFGYGGLGQGLVPGTSGLVLEAWGWRPGAGEPGSAAWGWRLGAGSLGLEA